MLGRIADNTGLTVASVEYRMAPEHAFPAPNEDTIDAAKFLLSKVTEEKYGKLRAIGGESAGAHLTMTTAFGLKRLGIDLSGIEALVCFYGMFDLRKLPSVYNYTGDIVLPFQSIEEFVGAYNSKGFDWKDSRLSPVFEKDMSNMPPAIFIVGTEDALLDDSLLMAPKYSLAGNKTRLVIVPNAPHAFSLFPAPDQDDGLSAAEKFIQENSNYTYKI